MPGHIWTLPDDVQQKINKAATATAKADLQRSWDLEYRTKYLFASSLGFAVLGVFFTTLLAFATIRLVFHGISRARGGKRTGSALAAFSRFLSEAPLLGTRRAQPYSVLNGALSFRAPIRIHAIIISCFYLVNILCIAAFYETWAGPDNPRYPTKSTYTQKNRYFSDRTAVLCISYLPVVILLSGRNSPAAFLTGISFSTQMLYHRWAGRMVALLALCHGGGYTARFIQRGDLQSLYKKDYVPVGIIALIALCCLCFFSLPVIRRFSHEIFLLGHIFFAALTLGCSFVHVQKLQEDSRMGDIYALLRLSIAAWIFDRVVRLARITYTSLAFSRFTAPHAEISLAAPGVLAIKIYPARHVDVCAGQYMNICFPTLQPFTVHPFSVIKTDNGERPCVHFAVKAHAGITRQLAKRVNRAQEETWSTTALLEGPYGKAIRPAAQGDLVLLAGGMGFTPCLSVLLEGRYLLHSQDEEKDFTASLRLVWVVRDLDIINAALPYLLELQTILERACARVQLDMFVTRSAASLPQSDSSEKHLATPPFDEKSSELCDQSLAYFPAQCEFGLQKLDRKYICVNFHEGRPDLDTVITSHDTDQRPVTVVVCGPATLSDHARRVALRMSRTREVHFFEECFDW